MPRDDLDTAIDIVNAAEAIGRFVEGATFASFSVNLEKRSAVMHQLMIMGEAAKRLSQVFRNQHPGIPWSEIAGMRDRLIHVYDDVDLKLVWDAATVHIPRLLEMIKPFVPKPPRGSSDV